MYQLVSQQSRDQVRGMDHQDVAGAYGNEQHRRPTAIPRIRRAAASGYRSSIGGPAAWKLTQVRPFQRQPDREWVEATHTWLIGLGRLGASGGGPNGLPSGP